jgi:hypothetical protein
VTLAAMFLVGVALGGVLSTHQKSHLLNRGCCDFATQEREAKLNAKVCAAVESNRTPVFSSLADVLSNCLHVIPMNLQH